MTIEINEVSEKDPERFLVLVSASTITGESGMRIGAYSSLQKAEVVAGGDFPGRTPLIWDCYLRKSVGGT